MKSKKEILEHCLEIIYEQLYMEQISLAYIEERNKELTDQTSFDYQSAKSKSLQVIDFHMRRINITKEMLKNE